MFIRRLYLSFDADWALWYTTRKNESRVYALAHVGFCPDFSPKMVLRLSVLNLTFLFFIFRIGWITRRKVEREFKQ